LTQKRRGPLATVLTIFCLRDPIRAIAAWTAVSPRQCKKQFFLLVGRRVHQSAITLRVYVTLGQSPV
jgi:hypothetical protein